MVIGVCSASEKFIKTIKKLYDYLTRTTRNIGFYIQKPKTTGRVIINNPCKMYHVDITGKGCLLLDPLFKTTISLARKDQKYSQIVAKYNTPIK